MTLAAPAQRVWEAALGRLQIQVPRPTYDTWLRGTEGQSFDDDRLVVATPSPFVAEWLQGRMLGLISEAVASVTGRSTAVALAVVDTPSSSVSSTPHTMRSVPKVMHPMVEPGPVASDRVLNPRYTLSSFVVGQSNRLAYAAAAAVADGHAFSYNPLFIHGAVGLGKTHLLHAIGHQARALGRSVRYATSEQFTNEFTAAIRDRRMANFQAQYRSIDVLLLDDIQFLAGKEGTQEAFFHTFNVLHSADRQIVVAADRPSSALTPFDERLRSRLDWGLTVDISAPDLETRVAILQHRARLAPVAVPLEVIHLLAEPPCKGVRELEAALNRVTALSHFTDAPVTLELVNQAIPSRPPAADTLAPEAVIARVGKYYNVPVTTLTGPLRSRQISHARQVAMFLLRRGGMHPGQIGIIFGGRDRTTVAYAIDRVSARIVHDADLQATIHSFTN